MRSLAALLAAAVVLACGMPPALAQRPATRTLGAATSALPSFDALVRFQATRLLGDRLPALADAEPLVSGVLVVVRLDGVLLWDTQVVPLDRGRFARTTLASCPGLCSVAVRDAVARALYESRELVRDGDEAAQEAYALVLADAEVPYGTLQIVLRSLSVASDGAPPGLGLVVRTPTSDLARLPVFVLPPQALRIGSAARPLLLELDVEAGKIRARTSPSFGDSSIETNAAAKLKEYLGHLKSRDPGKVAAFVAAPDGMPIKYLSPLLEVVRSLYPVIVLKPRGPLAVKIGE